VFVSASAQRNWPVCGRAGPRRDLGCRAGLLDGDPAVRQADAVQLAARDDAEQVRDRIVAEARSNPLALLELPRGLRPAELTGGFGLAAASPLQSRIEDSFTCSSKCFRATRSSCCLPQRPNRL
jgi:hypothetical protein